MLYFINTYGQPKGHTAVYQVYKYMQTETSKYVRAYGHNMYDTRRPSLAKLVRPPSCPGD